MNKFLKFCQWLIDITKEPIKTLIYNEAFIVLAAELPIVPKWCIKAVLKWSLNKTINPLINEAYAEIGYKISISEGEIILKRINNATTVNDWNNAINSGMQPNNPKRTNERNVR